MTFDVHLSPPTVYPPGGCIHTGPCPPICCSPQADLPSPNLPLLRGKFFHLFSRYYGGLQKKQLLPSTPLGKPLVKKLAHPISPTQSSTSSIGAPLHSGEEILACSFTATQSFPFSGWFNLVSCVGFSLLCVLFVDKLIATCVLRRSSLVEACMQL